MKTKMYQKLFSAVVISSAFLASCSQDELTNEDILSVEETTFELRTEETDADLIEAATLKMENEAPEDIDKRLKNLGLSIDVATKATLTNATVNRYYDSGRTVHSYYSPEVNRGERIGNFEGVAFRTTGRIGSSGVSSNFKLLVLFSHPQRIDFVMSTSGSEDISLINKGWRTNGTAFNVLLISRTQTPGTRRLYRFYKASNTDHLFTTNYSEGINNGYALENVIGWVK